MYATISSFCCVLSTVFVEQHLVPNFQTTAAACALLLQQTSCPVVSLKPVKCSPGLTEACLLDQTQHHTDAAVNMLITPICHTHSTWIHTEFDTWAPPGFCQRPPVLSSPSRPPVSEALRLGGLAAWRQGLEAPVHTGLRRGAICRLDR